MVRSIDVLTCRWPFNGTMHLRYVDWKRRVNDDSQLFDFFHAHADRSLRGP